MIAHAGANTPEALARMARHADVVEADVHRFHGRLEVRHAKTVGPLPVFWEGRRLLPFSTPRPPLAEVLAYVDASVDLMLDFKGTDPRLVRDVLAATRDWRAERRLFVSARSWRLADMLRGADAVTVLHSVGRPRGLRNLLASYRPDALEGVSIHRRLLTPSVVGALRERAPRVWTWPIDDAAAARDLAGWGVTGVISDAPERLASLRETRPSTWDALDR